MSFSKVNNDYIQNLFNNDDITQIRKEYKRLLIITNYFDNNNVPLDDSHLIILNNIKEIEDRYPELLL